MKETDAEFFFTLDDDAWFMAPDQLSRGVDWMNKNPHVGILAYDILLPGDKSVPLAKTPEPNHLFVGCGALIRRSALERVGYFRVLPAVYGGAEETDLCLRMFDGGYDVQIWRGLHIWHERTPVGRERFDQHSSVVCNAFAGLLIYCPMPLLPVLFAWRLFSFFRASGRDGEMKSYFAGLKLFVGYSRQALRARAPVSLNAYRTFMSRSRAHR
jgi:hypothetical protein